MKVHFLIFTFLIIILNSCKNIHKTDIVGTYVHYSRVATGSTMEIKSDSTYYYSWFQGLASQPDSGRWHIKGNTLILNSFNIPKIETDTLGFIKSSNHSQIPIMNVSVLDSLGKPIKSANCAFYFKQELIESGFTNENGEFGCKPLTCDSLSIYCHGYYPLNVKVSGTFNRFEIILPINKSILNWGNSYLDNASWKIKNGKLRNPETRRTKYEKNKYHMKQ
jgi:hypothetical protein